jgi:outer membrane assembly lipoprotein YfiO
VTSPPRWIARQCFAIACAVFAVATVAPPIASAQAGAPTTSSARNIWEWRNGQLTLTTPQPSTPTQPATDATLDKVDALLAAGQHKQARKLALRWERANRNSPLRDRVLLQIANAFYQYGDRTKAFFYCDELMDTYPQSGLFYDALDLQYRIADAYLGGYKQRVFGIPAVTVADDGIEMMYRIQQRSPGSPLAERALLRTADHYFANADYDLAGDAYAWYTRSYPRSPKVPRVRLRAAYSSLAQFRGLRYDSTPLIDAKAQFQALINDYPRLAAEENLPDLVARIDTTFARKTLVNGDFYRRTNQPLGAAYSFYDVIQTYPHTPEATEAAKALNTLPQPARDAAVAARAEAAPR